MLASFEGYVEIVGMLIKAKVEINTQDQVYNIMLLLVTGQNSTIEHILSHTVTLYQL